MARVHQNSVLRFSKLAAIGGTEFWTRPDLPEIPYRPDELVHVLEHGQRLDQLAHEYYDDHRLDWVIAAANGIRDMTLDLHVNMELRIPSPGYVTSELLAV